ncbi:hypothetical protein ASD18_17670 [Cellulomonas sp. Root137]|nr:hypothetical protein ASD18_17670 [Cellulomonas sp. Root137]
MDKAADGQPRQQRSFVLFVSLVFAYTVLGPGVNVLLGGRLPPTIYATAPVTATRLGGLVETACFLAVVAVACWILARSLRGVQAPLWHAVTFSTLLVAMSLVTVVTSGSAPNLRTLVVLLLVCWTMRALRPSVRDLALFGYLTITLATVSLAMGVLSDAGWIFGSNIEGAETKGLIYSGLLAGPYSQMNPLGMALAMGLPFVSLVPRAWLRRAGYAFVLGALVLTASRTALVAAVVMLVVFLVSVAVRSSARTVLAAASLVISVVIVALPLSTENARAFTERGQVWVQALDTVRSGAGPLTFGQGTKAFQAGSALTDSIGFVRNHGHNQAVTLLVMGGALALVCLGALIWAAVVRAAAVAPASLAPGLFVVCLLTIGVAETALRFEVFDGNAWIAWCGVFAIINLSADPTGVPGNAQPEGRRRALPTSPRPRVYTTFGRA